MENLLPANTPDFRRVEFNGEPVLTTAQLARAYGVTPRVIKQNFVNNRDRFIEGKHYYKLEGAALAEFKAGAVENFDSVNGNRVENLDLVAARTSCLYLWTKRGCLRHCKSIGTDVAWDVFEVLEENYFRPKPAEYLQPGAPFDFERGQALAKLVPHCKDSNMKHRLIAKAANLILGEEFFPIPADDNTYQLKLFYH